MCTMILKETIDYYRTNGNDAYCTMLDATKAFDRVEYCKLIRLLLIKNVPAVTIRFLLNLYSFQDTRVTWNGSYSHDIKILNGVRQGAVLSPVLFCIYFDEQMHALKSAKYGCYIGFCFIGVPLHTLTTWCYWRLVQMQQETCSKYAMNLVNDIR